jgi:hypothetical protein
MLQNSQLNGSASAPGENPEAQRLLKVLEGSGATKLPSPEQISQAIHDQNERKYAEPNLDRKREDPKTKRKNKIAAKSRKRNRRK